jgi:hypothetical protein
LNLITRKPPSTVILRIRFSRLAKEVSLATSAFLTYLQESNRAMSDHIWTTSYCKKAYVNVLVHKLCLYNASDCKMLSCSTIYIILLMHFFPMVLQPTLEPCPPLYWSFLITIKRMVELLWTSNQPVAEAATYTREHNI